MKEGLEGGVFKKSVIELDTDIYLYSVSLVPRWIESICYTVEEKQWRKENRKEEEVSPPNVQYVLMP